MIGKYIVVLAIVAGCTARIPTPIRPIPGSVIPTPRPSVQPPVIEILPTPELGYVNVVVPEVRPEIVLPEIGVRPEIVLPEIGVRPEVVLPEIGVRPEVIPDLEVSPELIERPQILPGVVVPEIQLPGGVMPSLPSIGCGVVPEVPPPVVAPVRPELRPVGNFLPINPTIIR